MMPTPTGKQSLTALRTLTPYPTDLSFSFSVFEDLKLRIMHQLRIPRDRERRFHGMVNKVSTGA
jgi:hypothetical protein